MDEIRSKNIIESLQKKWSVQLLLSYVLLALAITISLSIILDKTAFASWVITAPVLIIVFIAAFLFFNKKVNSKDVIQFLNEAFPELQESTNLVLTPYENLNMLEKLQLKRVESTLSPNVPAPPLVRKRTRIAFIASAIALLFSLVFSLIPFHTTHHLINANESLTNPAKPESKLPQVKDVTVRIAPPTYTRKGAREQNKFNIVAEQDAVLSWNISTTLAVKDVQLLFNDKTVIHLQPDKNRTGWVGKKEVKNAGFYQVKISNTLSELYQVEMIKDQPPTIIIQSPKPNTVIEYGQPQKVLVNVTLSDDYGIETSFINATTASGSGEAVKFKEQQVPFLNLTPGGKQQQVQRQIDLAALGMQPGDELYFYVDAKDTYHQEKRSDVYIVRMEDTAQLMSMDGLVSGVNLKPEFFRSERQIIIETEQLLKDRDTISIASFNKKSTDLGVDQKLLRLRYGKFLGEENETEIGEDHDHNDGTQNNTADFNNADKILDQYSHKHDIAEDASFFDAQTKKQLLATLSEMWEAELQLRTLKPKEALPFEYKALRLLKDLQQSTRAYVSKTDTKTTPLKPEIRLTGDLSKIIQPVNQENFQQKPDGIDVLRKALGVLEMVRNKEPLQRSSIDILQQASLQLSNKAAAAPSAYLASFEALRRILRNKFIQKDVDQAGSAFVRMIRAVPDIPQKSEATPDLKLSQCYFNNLNKKND